MPLTPSIDLCATLSTPYYDLCGQGQAVSIGTGVSSGSSSALAVPGTDPFFADVLLLLPFNEPNGSFTHIDYSSYGRTPTAYANQQFTSSAQAKWGSTSLRVGANLQTTTDATYYYRSPDFRRTGSSPGSYTEMTMEFWLWRATGGYNSTASPPIFIWRADDQVVLEQVVNYSDVCLLDATGHPQTPYSPATWHFIAIVWDSMNANRLYLDGNLISTSTGFTAFIGSPYIHIASFFSGTANAPYNETYMQDVRVTRRARYFGPTCPVPTGPFPTS